MIQTFGLYDLCNNSGGADIGRLLHPNQLIPERLNLCNGLERCVQVKTIRRGRSPHFSPAPGCGLREARVYFVALAQGAPTMLYVLLNYASARLGRASSALFDGRGLALRLAAGVVRNAG